jgi:hypothetical protein
MKSLRLEAGINVETLHEKMCILTVLRVKWKSTRLWDVETLTFSRYPAHRWRWFVRLSRRPPFTPREIPGTHFSRTTVRLEELDQLKNQMTSSGIKIATFRPPLWLDYRSLVLLSCLCLWLEQYLLSSYYDNNTCSVFHKFLAVSSLLQGILM